MQTKGNAKRARPHAEGGVSPGNGHPRPNVAGSRASSQFLDSCPENGQKGAEHARPKSDFGGSDCESLIGESVAKWRAKQTEQEPEEPKRDSWLCEEKLGRHPGSGG